ncbi:hypothetical protein [Haloarcula pelagica]|uniref:hypothetical protein n=1 Tax=Haloarcula pelagica TaxID=3033389 RepID=UPI0024C38FE4|nr:hypothetical protein [Halomicroarcula sp. YJ-61-S]
MSGSVAVGLTPGGWDFAGGVVVALALGYLFLRRVIDAFLTEPQEWLLFALVGTVFASLTTGLVWSRGNRPSRELVFSYVLCLTISIGFGYRALPRDGRS